VIGPGQDLNRLFARLDEQGVRVRSMRNKANRLEELFLRLVDSDRNSARAAE
jgi:ABC-2 type transport system ATP-binding protein